MTVCETCGQQIVKFDQSHPAGVDVWWSEETSAICSGSEHYANFMATQPRYLPPIETEWWPHHQPLMIPDETIVSELQQIAVETA